jgi:fatty acid amide hydrolase 2
MLLATSEAPLTEWSALRLADAIRSGETDSRAVVETHIEVHQRAGLNAVVADRYEQALAEADDADRRIAAGEDVGSPLLGVPFTVKESIALEGMPHCAGLSARAEHRASESATAVQRVLDAGAIPLGVTNISELTMWIEADNPVYGRTLNPYDRRRIVGGSSGGEGAAVGSGGSPFGIGTDIGGSIRFPAFCNGVFGHKCSPGVVPNTGQWPLTTGEASRLLALGPLTRRAEDLMPLLRLIAGVDGVDAGARSVELGDPDEVSISGLDVVISESAWFVPVRREIREARERVAGALAAAGASVRRESMRSMRRALELYLAALQSGAGISISEILEGEGASPITARSALRRNHPHSLPLTLLVFSERLGDRVPERQTRRALAAARSLTEEVEGIVGDGVLLHPPHARMVPRHGTTTGQPWLITPQAVFNLLGLPATQVPMGLSRKGLPLGVQVAAGPDRDHVAIAVAIELERVFGGWVPPWRAG